ncbi:MAG: ribosome biogenesis factor YjgA [Pseudomonadota bacterium]
MIPVSDGLIGPVESNELSKSERKRQAQALFELGQRLVDLSDQELSRVPLDDDLRDLLVRSRSVTSHVARKRQLGFVAKQLRQIDPEAIYAALEAIDEPANQDRERLHRLEAWREHLIAGGRAALNALSAQVPGLDRPKLAALARRAATERTRGEPPRAARELFQLLKELDRQQSLTPPQA